MDNVSLEKPVYKQPEFISSVETINLLTLNPNCSPEAFYIERREGFQPEIKRRSLLSELFVKTYHAFSSGAADQHKNELKDAVHSNISYLNQHENVCISPKGKGYTNLFIHAHRFNHMMEMRKNDQLGNNVSLFNELDLQETFEFKGTEAVKIKNFEKSQMEDIPHDQHAHIAHKHLTGKKCYHYNEADLKHSHKLDAAQIFVSTQSERLMSAIGRIIESVSGFFGHKISFSPYHYFRNGETKNDIYANYSPIAETKGATSFFIGHATCAMNVPVQPFDGGEPFKVNIITDPVEGDLNKILYPRMTDPARTMDQIPVPHVFLLSHNHLDHYDRNTLLKLVKYQPLMIVPAEDKEKFIELGFKNIVENNWWEKTSITLEHNGRQGLLEITTVPANHWSGQGVCDDHEAASVGYVIHNKQGGDIYFAGDTARLDDMHIGTLIEKFNITSMFQPGGPDESRENMKGTHQASVDGVWMHSRLLMTNLYTKGNFKDRTKEEFIDQAKELRTLYMHNKTYKLGNLHFDDTDASIGRLKKALKDA
jgi:L-ascorbate metabolism protein UlaG (beta-lactamase superfamily)